MAGADKKGHQVAGNRGAGRAGKPRKEREGENRPERTPQNKAVAEKKGGRQPPPLPLCPNGAGNACTRNQRARGLAGMGDGAARPCWRKATRPTPNGGKTRTKDARGRA